MSVLFQDEHRGLRDIIEDFVAGSREVRKESQKICFSLVTLSRGHSAFLQDILNFRDPEPNPMRVFVCERLIKAFLAPP